MKKKILNILLTLCLTLTLLPTAALAAFRINAQVTVNVNGTASGNYTVYLDKDESKTENWQYTLTYGGGNYSLDLDVGDEGPFYVYVYSGTSLAYRSSAAEIYYINDDDCKNLATVNFYNLGGDAPQLAPTATWVNEISKNGAVSGTDYVIDGNSVTINTNRGLAWLASDSTYWASNYTVSLAADIDMSTRIWTPIGSSGTAFSGTFDGQWHTVSGVYINSGNSSQGLFAYLSGDIKNLGIVDSYIAGNQHIGGIAGDINTGGTVSSCYNTGTVSGTASIVGGIVGYINGNGGTVSNSYNTGTVSGTVNIGGIVGYINGNGCSVSNSYNTGTVSGNTNNTGGIAGYCYSGGSVSSCYNTGTVSGPYKGGIVGSNSGSVSYCHVLQTCGPTAICSSGTAASDSAWFADSVGTLYNASSGTTTATGYGSTSTLLASLNAWVTDNNSGGAYCIWFSSGGVNNGYPVFGTVLTGTAEISGGAVFGEALTASLTGGNNTGTLSYQWMRGSTDITGATGNEYMLVEADIGAAIAVKISSSVEMGTLTSSATSAVQKADCATATGITPVLSATTTTGITVTAVTGYEYICVADNASADTGSWQDTNVFTGLTANTTYDIYQRVKETATHKASALSAKLDVTTNPAGAGGGSSSPSRTITVTETSSGLFDGTQGAVKAEANMTSAFSNSVEVKVTDTDESASGFGLGIGNTVYPFDISLYIKGTNTKTEPKDGYAVTISLPVPDDLLDMKEQLSVAHKSDGGSITTLASELKQINGVWYLVFKATDFSPYALVVNDMGAYDETAGLPYYVYSEGKEVFIGFAANGKYIAPSGVTVLVKENTKSFTDTDSHWAKDYIEFVTEREIFLGTGNGYFSPDSGMTRAMFATVIGRLYERSYGEIETVSTHDFTDCDYGEYYGKYVDWAAENGILGGYGNGKFGPGDQVTREQMAAILYRFADYLDVLPKDMDTTLNYPDADTISSWAQSAALYCQTTGIITGRNGGSFVPQGNATRAEVAVILERFIKNILG